ncbi:MAG: heat shock protein HslJ [Flavobacteriaceae bacterium]|jgi:heat shock protein HslJ
MKKLLFFSILLLAFGCNSLKEKQGAGTTDNTLKAGSYSVTSITGTDISSENLTLVISEEGQKISGFCGCNNYSGNINPQGSETLFSRLISTKIYCNSGLTTEELFLKEMRNVASVSVKENTINLKNASGGSIILVLNKFTITKKGL